MGGHVETVRLLLAAGANKNKANGNTALSYATATRRKATWGDRPAAPGSSEGLVCRSVLLFLGLDGGFEEVVAIEVPSSRKTGPCDCWLLRL